MASGSSLWSSGRPAAGAIQLLSGADRVGRLFSRRLRTLDQNLSLSHFWSANPLPRSQSGLWRHDSCPARSLTGYHTANLNASSWSRRACPSSPIPWLGTPLGFNTRQQYWTRVIQTEGGVDCPGAQQHRTACVPAREDSGQKIIATSQAKVDWVMTPGWAKATRAVVVRLFMTVPLLECRCDFGTLMGLRLSAAWV